MIEGLDRMMNGTSVDSHEQLAGRDVQGTRELDDRAEARVAFGALEAADLGEVHAADRAERLLRDRPRRAARAVRSEDVSRLHAFDDAARQPKSPEPTTLTPADQGTRERAHRPADAPFIDRENKYSATSAA